MVNQCFEQIGDVGANNSFGLSYAEVVGDTGRVIELVIGWIIKSDAECAGIAHRRHDQR